MNYQKRFIDFHETIESSVESNEGLMEKLNGVYEIESDRKQFIRVIDYLGIWQRFNLESLDSENVTEGLVELAKVDFNPVENNDLEALKKLLMKLIDRYIIVDSSIGRMNNLNKVENQITQEEVFSKLELEEIEEMNMRTCELHNILNAVSFEDDEVKGSEFLRDAFGEKFIRA